MTRSASDLFIVDNSDFDWKVRSFVAEWCALSSAIDIATGYFEIGALLALGEAWQTVDSIRILMGGERVLTEPGAIANLIRSEPDTPRRATLARATLADLRKQVERQVIADYLRPLQAPVGVTPILKCWMELN